MELTVERTPSEGQEGPVITSLPVLPAKRTVVFPGTLIPLAIGRRRSIAAVEAAIATEEKTLLVVAQREAETENPKRDDLYPIGTKVIIKQVGKTAEGHLHILVQGVERMVLLKLEQEEPFLCARVRQFPLPEESSPEIEALHRALLDLAGQLPDLISTQGFTEIIEVLRAEQDPVLLAYRLASFLNLTVERLQAILEIPSRAELLRQVYATLSHEIQILKLRNEIASQAQAEIGKSQREYFLRQQLKEIQQELGEDQEGSDVALLKQRIEEADLPDRVREEALREVKRLGKLPAMAPDFQVIRSYLELLLELPWNAVTEDRLDLTQVRQVLDEDHYG
ncbi:MAG: endopeptidase La, partial [Nitrospirae bacterium]